MNNIYKELSAKIIKNEKYLTSCGALFKAYINKMLGEEYEISREEIKKLTTTCQYYYFADETEFKNEGAILLSMLLYVAGEEYPEVVAIAEEVFYRAGDFPNIQLLKDKFQNILFRVSVFNEVEKEFRRDIHTIEAIAHPLTDYQRTLWQDLSSDEDVITSAPTSAGKTYIILNYIVHKLIDFDGFGVVVVPTRALITEVAGNIYQIAKEKNAENEIEICTIPKDGIFKSKTIFVMTQERLFEVLQGGDLSFDYLFVDEAHNISDQSRGVLLHLTLQKMLEDSNPQVIISMPSEGYQNAYDSVFEGIDFKKKITKHSPVAKIIIDVALRNKSIELSRVGKPELITINKNFTGKGLADIVYRLGKGESNIIYQNQTNSCELTASKIANLITQNKKDKRLDESADYIEKFIHQDYSLAACLRKGVAFHYGPLPSVIRTAVESLVKERAVQYVVCTSTLAEGINLPAKNLFLKNPFAHTPKGDKSAKLEKVKIANIIGRAGRMLEHFSGNIFLIEQEDWLHEYDFEDSNETADKIPTYFKVLNENLPIVLDALDGSLNHEQSNQTTYYTIANKLLKEFAADNLSSTINAGELNLAGYDVAKLKASVKKAYEELKVDSFTLESSPTVGFIQQNKLYTFISQQHNLKEWVLPHPKSPLLYERLTHICSTLIDTGILQLNDNVTINHACLLTKKWVQGDSLKTIITEQVSYDAKHKRGSNVNKIVRDVMKILNNDVRFRMLSALRCYHSLLTDIITTKKLDISTTKLHAFIEVGSCDESVINLINLGLTRDTALEINRVLNNQTQIESIAKLKKLYDRNEFNELHPVTKREIIQLTR